MTIEEMQGRKPLDGLACFLRVLEQTREWQAWSFELGVWREEIAAIQAAISQSEEEE